MKLTSVLTAGLLLGVLANLSAPRVRADVVTDWNAQLEFAQKASAQASSGQSRSGAIVHAAIFDAVNGIARKYEPYWVDDSAPRGASQEAAAIQAAYVSLVALYPGAAQVAMFDAQLATSLAGLADSAKSIEDGRAWGALVAQNILAWRAADGFRNVFSYLGVVQPGCWRTPTAGLSGVNVQFATMEPFLLQTPAQFRPAAPYGAIDRLTALASSAYAADLNEVKLVGGATSAARTAAQTELARFWNSVDVADQNRALRSLVSPGTPLVDNARLFALCNLAAADASIVVYDAKYAFGLWRPVDAIRLADTDGNAATEPDPSWNSLAATPRHPEYPSAHSMISGAMLGTAAILLGDNQPFVLSTPGWPSVVRTYGSFSAAVAEVVDARVWIGFHFRTACLEGSDTGYEIALHGVRHALRPLRHDSRWRSFCHRRRHGEED